VSARFHPFVQDADDLDDAGLDTAVVDNMHGVPDGVRAAFLLEIAQVKAPDTRQELLTTLRYWTLGIGRNLSQSRNQLAGVPSPGVIAPALGARREDLVEIRLRRAREPKSRHASAAAPAPSCDETRHVGVEVPLVDLHKLATLERIDSGLELRAERLQLQRVLAAPLLQNSQRVEHRFACVLVFASLD
jgi:hypothetical protein